MRNYTENEYKAVHSHLLRLLKAFKDVCDAENIWYSLAFGTVLGAVRHKGFIPWDTDADVCIKLGDVDRFREAFYRHKPEGIALQDRSSDPHDTTSHDILYFESDLGFASLHLDIYPLIGAPQDKQKQIKVWKRNYFLDRVFRSKYENISNCLKENRRKVFIVKIIDRFIPDRLIQKNIKKRENEFKADTSGYWTCLAAPYLPVQRKVWKEITLMKFEDTEFFVPGDWDLYLKSIYGDYMTPRKY